MYLGSNPIIKMYLGSEEIIAKYLGENIIYSAESAVYGYVSDGSTLVRYSSDYTIPSTSIVRVKCAPMYGATGYVLANQTTSTPGIFFRVSATVNTCLLAYRQDNGAEVEFEIPADVSIHDYKFDRDGTNVDLYIDNVLYDTLTIASLDDMTINQISARGVTPTNPYIGKIAEVEINSEVTTFKVDQTVFIDGVNTATIAVGDDGERIQEIIIAAGNAGILYPSRLVDSAQSGLVTISVDGTVVENQNFRGTYWVRANNVTIKNCKIDGALGEFGSYGIWEDSGHTGNIFEENEVVNCSSSGVLARGAEVTRNYFHNMAGDGMKALATGSVFTENYIAELGTAEGAHGDGLQITQGLDIDIIRNHFVLEVTGATNNGAIFINATGGVTNTLIQGNILEGGGYTLGLSATHVNTVVDSNYFGNYQFGHWNITATAQPGVTVNANNISLLTGLVIPVTFPIAPV